ncbi:MAG: DUF177 domain-containing protein [Chloroflexi bacterium]|nr:DUF177 domain-containing protein [Chloroflexota bacterium]
MLPMLYNVSTILKEHTGASREYDVDDDVQIDGETHSLHGHVRLDRTPRGVLVRAALRGTVQAPCSRCLRPATLPIDLAIEEEFVPTIDVISGARIETLEGEEDAYRISARHELDLREPVRQYWAMAMPMAPLCREDCAGLCPACGSEMNPEHACAQPPLDERWAKLARLNEG